MKKELAGVAAVCLIFGVPGFAHRLDEYLQATIISVEKDRVRAFMRLTPGVAVYSKVLTSIDTNNDGMTSDVEERAYADRVLGDLSLTADGERLKPRLTSVAFPPAGEMKAGLGEIQIEFAAELPRSSTNRKLLFENHHQSRIAAYLVNCLVPSDRNIKILGQERNQNQSVYQLSYAQAGGASYAPSAPGNSTVPRWLATLTLSLLTGFMLVWAAVAAKRRTHNSERHLQLRS